MLGAMQDWELRVSHLIDHAGELRDEWVAGVTTVGVSSGASAPEDIVQDVLEDLRRRGVNEVEEVDAPDEDVVFSLPRFTT